MGVGKRIEFCWRQVILKYVLPCRRFYLISGFRSLTERLTRLWAGQFLEEFSCVGRKSRPHKYHLFGGRFRSSRFSTLAPSHIRPKHLYSIQQRDSNEHSLVGHLTRLQSHLRMLAHAPLWYSLQSCAVSALSQSRLWPTFSRRSKVLRCVLRLPAEKCYLCRLHYFAQG